MEILNFLIRKLETNHCSSTTVTVPITFLGTLPPLATFLAVRGRLVSASFLAVGGRPGPRRRGDEDALRGLRA